MEKKILLLLCGIAPLVGFSQVGINTANPQQLLHISGSPTPFASAPTVGTTSVKVIEPTMTIDGLNATNNPAHNADPNSIQRVYVSENGDLMLRKGNSNFLLVNEIGTIDENTVGIPASGDSYEKVSVVLKSVSFTLDQESIVNVSASVAAKVENFGTTSLTLNQDFEYHSAISFQFTNAPAEMIDLVDKQFSETSFKLLTVQQIIQKTDFTLASNKNLVLKPGIYTVDLIGSFSGRRDKKTRFGYDDEKEYFKIVAIPTNKK